MNTQVLQGLLVPFLGTTLGAALVFFLKRDSPEKVQKVMFEVLSPNMRI